MSESESQADDAPTCPICGNPAKKFHNSGSGAESHTLADHIRRCAAKSRGEELNSPRSDLVEQMRD